MADYWIQNADFFRRLYQDERKTLEQVKAIAERQLRPSDNYTISTYEARLRDVLKLRKKLKKRDWYLIHHYAACRGLGRGGYIVLLNGTQIRSDRVWKEIRRYGYHKETECGQVICLPRDVEVRPQRDFIASSITDQSYSLSSTQNAKNTTQRKATSSSTCDALQTWDDFSAALAQIDTWTVSDQVDEEHPIKLQEDVGYCKSIELLHDQLPWNRLRVAVLEILSGRKVAYTWPDSEGHYAKYMPNDGFMDMTPGWLVAGFAATTYPRTLSLHARGIPSDSVEMNQLVWYYHFAKIAFRLTDEDFRELELFDFIEFGTALRLVHSDIVSRIIQGHHLSIRAIWDRFCDKLFHLAQRPRSFLRRGSGLTDENLLTNACESIIDTTMRTHPEWLESQRGINWLLMSCGWVRSKTLMLRLLARGAELHYGECGQTYSSTLTHSAEAGYREIVVALTSAVDMSAFVPSTISVYGPGMSHFARFLWYMFHDMPRLRSPVEVENVYKSLEWIANSRADVDGPFPVFLQTLGWISGGEVSSALTWPTQFRFTCLDAAFYFDRRAFQIMLPYTKRELTSMTRPGICEAAAAGTQALDAYLSSFTEVTAIQKSEFLRMVLTEQLLITTQENIEFIGYSRMYLLALDPSRAAVFRALLKYHDLPNSVIGNFLRPLLLEICLASFTEYGLTEDLYAIFLCLCQEPIDLRSRTLEQCIESQGTNLLDFLLYHNVICRRDVQEYGTQALRQAVTIQNCEAVTWLIDMGVSVQGGDLDGITIMGHCMLNYYDEDDECLSICRCLTQHGAELKWQTWDRSCSKLFSEALRLARNANAMLACWQFFEGFPTQLAKVSVEEWRAALESVLLEKPGWDVPRLLPWIVEELLHRTRDADGNPSLVLAIQARQSKMAWKLLDSQADIEERSPCNNTPLGMAISIRNFALARRLIDMGANVNAQIGWINAQIGSTRVESGSAMSKACDQTNCDESERVEGMDMIRDLIGRGATLGEEYVPVVGRAWFRFPLYVCAWHGSVEVATLVLQQHVDVNLITVESEDNEVGDRKWTHTAYTALDAAAELYRLDMMLLLLRAGGLSSVPGSSGYNGVLAKAKERGRYAAVNMVEQHICDLEKEFRDDPGRRSDHLRKIQRVREQAYEMVCRAMAEEERLNEERGYW